LPGSAGTIRGIGARGGQNPGESSHVYTHLHVVYLCSAAGELAPPDEPLAWVTGKNWIPTRFRVRAIDFCIWFEVCASCSPELVFERFEEKLRKVATVWAGNVVPWGRYSLWPSLYNTLMPRSPVEELVILVDKNSHATGYTPYLLAKGPSGTTGSR
jgi:hypothetical protein